VKIFNCWPSLYAVCMDSVTLLGLAPRRSRGRALGPSRFDPWGNPRIKPPIQVREAMPPGGGARGAVPPGQLRGMDPMAGVARGRIPLA
jgi:hypothetical protein